jgi:hypothetical protein
MVKKRERERERREGGTRQCTVKPFPGNRLLVRGISLDLMRCCGSKRARNKAATKHMRDEEAWCRFTKRSRSLA